MRSGWTAAAWTRAAKPLIDAGLIKRSGQSLNIYSGLGLLLLMGLAKKNSILLVDRANQAHKSPEFLQLNPNGLIPVLVDGFISTAAAMIAVGLAPLQALHRALEALRAGRAGRLDGRFPGEVQPLVDDFNAVLEHDARLLERARKHAGNLAHALKTPLAVLQNAADQLAAGKAEPAQVAQAITQQLAAARRQVDWHLARARAAALHHQLAEVRPRQHGRVGVLIVREDAVHHLRPRLHRRIPVRDPRVVRVNRRLRRLLVREHLRGARLRP